MKYTLQELKDMKGTSEPVRHALQAMSDEIEALRQEKRKPLTDEQIDRLDCVTLHMPDYERFEVFQPSVIEFARAIEAAHGIK